MAVVSPDIRRAAHGALAPAAAVVAVSVVAAYLAVWGRRYGVDLAVYRGGVKTLVGGHSPYASRYTRYGLPYTYPPFSLVALAPLALLGFTLTQWLWWAVSLVALGGALAVARVATGTRPSPALAWTSVGWAALAVLVVEPVRSTFDYGQVNTVLMVMVVADVLAVPRRHRGWLVGVAAAVKLTPIVFVALFAVERDLRSALRAAASFVVLSGVTWIAWPSVSAHYWIHQLGSPAQIGPLGSPSNQSLYGILHRPPFPAAAVTAAWLGTAVVVAGLALFVAQRCVARGGLLHALVAVALAGLLVSPVSWSHHWVWVVLLPVAVLGSSGATLAAPVRVALGGILLLAVAGPYWWLSHGALSDVLMDIMPLWALGTLALWAGTERLRGTGARRVAGAVTHG